MVSKQAISRHYNNQPVPYDLFVSVPAIVGAFNQEKSLDDSFAALVSMSVPRSRKMLSLMTRSLQLLTLTLAAVCLTKVVSVTRKCFTSSALIWTLDWVQTCKQCLMMIEIESSNI